MESDTTQLLARFAADTTYDQIPDRVRLRCKELLLDALACALAGHRSEEMPQVLAFASSLAQSRESTVLGGDRLSLAGATLLNGFLITGVTMCDVHRPTLTHVTPVVFPPALAIAERERVRGRDLLVALAVGLETTTRVGLGLDFQVARSRGWHGPGLIGPFGGAAAAGRLLGLDSRRMAAAFGLAGSQSAGTFAAWGTPTVKFHQSRGALSGLMSALLAQQGFGATHRFLTAKDGGLFSTYSDGGKPEAATEGLGDRWELEQIALRLWPSGANLQPMATAMFDLLARHDVKPQDTRKLRLTLSKTAFDLHGGFSAYRAKFEALLSAHYSAAIILHDRELTLDQFEPARYDAPSLRRFAAEQVEVVCDPRLSKVQAAVELETVDGRTLSARCDVVKGSPENRLTRAEIEGKFRRYAVERISPKDAEATIEAVSHLEELDSTATLMERLRSRR